MFGKLSFKLLDIIFENCYFSSFVLIIDFFNLFIAHKVKVFLSIAKYTSLNVPYPISFNNLNLLIPLFLLATNIFYLKSTFPPEFLLFGVLLREFLRVFQKLPPLFKGLGE